MRPKVTAINLTTSGQAIVPSQNVTLIVGPNNVGKSAVLAGAQQEIAMDVHQPPIIGDRPVAGVVVTMPTLEDLTQQLDARAKLYPAGNHPHGSFREATYVFANGTTVPQAKLMSLASRSDRFGELAGAMMLFMGPEGRGGVLSSQGLPDLMTNQARSPMQMLWEDRALEKLASGYMRRAFDKDLLVNRHAGANVHLHIGNVSVSEPQIGVKSEYLEEAMKLPLLSAQGSGMQAFMGTVLTLATATYDIVFLDEPETFLHPPQAKLLGEVVAEMSRDNHVQVIVATHSDDFVQGVINASKDDSEVAVVRLTRPTDAENRVAQVAPEALKSLYRDPLLRYSDIMDGIFYKGVVLCEAESDCTYYAATLGHLEESQAWSASDLLFTQCGGKDRFNKAYSALAAAAVPTAVIADVDLLADKDKFEELFQTMGGNFAAIEASYNVLESSVKNHKVYPERSTLGAAVDRVIAGSQEKYLTPAELPTLRDLLRAESGWKNIKRKGEGAIDSGDPSSAFKSILSACAPVGLFILSIGELERFHPDVAGNKQEWLRKVLENELFKTFGEAHELMVSVRKFVSAHQ